MTTTLLKSYEQDGKIIEVWEENLGAGLNKGTRVYQTERDAPIPPPAPEPTPDPMTSLIADIAAIKEALGITGGV